MPVLEFTSTCNFKKQKSTLFTVSELPPRGLNSNVRSSFRLSKTFIFLMRIKSRNNLLKHCLHTALSVLISENRYGVKGFKISRTRPHCTPDTVQSGSEQLSHSQVLGDCSRTAPLDHDNLRGEGCLEARSRGSVSEGLHLGTLSVSGVQRRRRSPEHLWLQILKWGADGSGRATGGLGGGAEGIGRQGRSEGVYNPVPREEEGKWAPEWRGAWGAHSLQKTYSV